MRIVFMGTPAFAVESLNKINKSHHEVVGVITATDKPAGRGQKLSFSDVKQYSLDNNLRLLQPPNLKDPIFIDELKSLNADLFVVVAFRMLPDVVWKMPKSGTINLHASLLPQYRGAAPINWAIINGEKISGATTFFIEEKIDTGNVINRIETSIGENMSAGELHDLLMLEGADLLLDTINNIEKGTALGIPQINDSGQELKKAFKIFKETCEIDWHKSSSQIHNLIRGLSPYPAAYTTFKIDDKELTAKIYQSKVSNEEKLSVGEINTDKKNYFTIGCLDGNIDILEIQIAGKKRMDIKSFLNGYKQNEISLLS